VRERSTSFVKWRAMRCAECGFDWEGTQAVDLVDELRVLPDRYRMPLTRFLPGEDAALLRSRPEPAVWSALEYAAHTADALDFYAGRIARVLDEDRPELTAFDFDAACAQRRYNERSADEVLDGLAGSAARLADLLEVIDAAAWDRVGIGSDGGDRSVLLLARRAVHEGHHHLLDVGRVLRHVRGR